MFKHYDYECSACGKVFEEMVANEEEELPCTSCTGKAKRLISVSHIDWRRMGLDPGFPSAYEKWGNEVTKRQAAAPKK